MHWEIEAVLRAQGVLDLRKHPQHEHRVRRLHRAGQLSRVLPGIWAAAGEATSPAIRLLAAGCWTADGVLSGRAAARISFWPHIALKTITLSAPARLVPQPGFEVRRERLPAELVSERDGLRFTVAALTALDLVAELGGAGIDEVLRTGAARLPDLWRALELTPHRRGNAVRRQLLNDSRDAPWSEAERLLHRLLRAAGLTGWETNVPVGWGEFRCILDAAFPVQRVGIEVDGFAFHAARPGQREQFDWDRYRDSTLVAHGWRMLHFTWTQLTDQPEWVVGTIRAALACVKRIESTSQGRTAG